MSKRAAPSPLPNNPDARDAYTRAVIACLEHMTEPDWLARQSPLSGILVSTDAGAADDVQAAGRALQRALTTARDTAALDRLERTVLDATYFERAAWKADEVNIIGLARRIGDRVGINLNDRAYYRARLAAVGKLAGALLAALHEHGQTEKPPLVQMVGRANELEITRGALEQGRSLSIIGPSGIGKTTLLARLAQDLRAAGRAVVWFVVRVGLADQPLDLLRALIDMLHARGQHAAWLYFASSGERLDGGRLADLVRADLTALGAAPRPVLFLDEADLLGRRSAHMPGLRQLLDSLSAHVTLVLGGLRTVLPTDVLVELPSLGEPDVAAMLRQAGAADVDPAQVRALCERTRGNAALVAMLIALHQAGRPIGAELARLGHAPTLAALLDRLQDKLSVEADALVRQLSVYRQGAPRLPALNQSAALGELFQLGLARPERGRVWLSEHIGVVVRKRLAAASRRAWNLDAAHALEQTAGFVEAMHHYVQAGAPAHAIRLWAAYGSAELARGNATQALRVLAHIPPDAVLAPRDKNEDWRGLLILQRAQLRAVLGGTTSHVRELAGAQPHGKLLKAFLAERMAAIDSVQGQSDAALRNYDRALGLLAGTPEGLLVRIYSRRSHLLRMDGMKAEAALDATRAHVSAAVFHGSSEREASRFESAERLYKLALEMCKDLEPNSRQEALALEHYANMLWQLQRLDESMALFVRALEIATSNGDVFAECVIQGGMSAVHILAGRHARAREVALAGLVTARRIRYVPIAGLLATDAAEACYHLGDLALARQLASEAIASESAIVIPNSYWVLAMCAHAEGRAEQAIADMRLSLQAAQDIDDLYGAAVAWLGLGDVLGATQPGEATRAYQQALDYFEHHRIGAQAEHARAGLRMLQLPQGAADAK